MTLMTELSDLAIYDSVSGDGGSVHLMKRLRWIAAAGLLDSSRDGHADTRAIRP
jgi:hypothetical protein